MKDIALGPRIRAFFKEYQCAIAAALIILGTCGLIAQMLSAIERLLGAESPEFHFVGVVLFATLAYGTYEMFRNEIFDAIFVWTLGLVLIGGVLHLKWSSLHFDVFGKWDLMILVCLVAAFVVGCIAAPKATPEEPRRSKRKSKKRHKRKKR